MSGQHFTRYMPTVVHVGPISSPGGIQSVIKTLTDHPPEGWDVQQIESHSDGSLYSKLKAYSSAKTELIEKYNQANTRPKDKQKIKNELVRRGGVVFN